MRGLMVGVVAVALAGCAPAIRDRSLDGLDLADGATLASLQEALPQDERAALGTYALLHWPKSKFYCGKPIGGRPAEARTIGEAVALTRAYEAALAQSQRDEQATPGAARQREERALITQMEQLVLERDMLFAQAGPSASESQRASEIKEQLASLSARLSGLRRGPAG